VQECFPRRTLRQQIVFRAPTREVIFESKKSSPAITERPSIEPRTYLLAIVLEPVRRLRQQLVRDRVAGIGIVEHLQLRRPRFIALGPEGSIWVHTTPHKPGFIRTLEGSLTRPPDTCATSLARGAGVRAPRQTRRKLRPRLPWRGRAERLRLRIESTHPLLYCRLKTEAPDVAATLLLRVNAALAKMKRRGLASAEGKPVRWANIL
jgi:hypothetical protein